MSIDPTEIRDVPCSVCERFLPEDELSLEDDLCWDCSEELSNENE